MDKIEFIKANLPVAIEQAKGRGIEITPQVKQDLVLVLENYFNEKSKGAETASENNVEVNTEVGLGENIKKYSNKDFVVSQTTANIFNSSEKNQLTTAMSIEAGNVSEAKEGIDKETSPSIEEGKRKDMIPEVVSNINNSILQLEELKKVSEIRKDQGLEETPGEKKFKTEKGAYAILNSEVMNILRKINLQSKTDKTIGDPEYDKDNRRIKSIGFPYPDGKKDNQLTLTFEGPGSRDKLGRPLSTMNGLLENMTSSESEKPTVFLKFPGGRSLKLESGSVIFPGSDGHEVSIGPDSSIDDQISLLRGFVEQLSKLDGSSDVGPHTAELKKYNEMAEKAIVLIEKAIAKSKENPSPGETYKFIQEEKRKQSQAA